MQFVSRHVGKKEIPVHSKMAAHLTGLLQTTRAGERNHSQPSGEAALAERELQFPWR